MNFLLFWNYWIGLVVGKLLIIKCGMFCNLVFSVRQNARSGPLECEFGRGSKRDILCCSL